MIYPGTASGGYSMGGSDANDLEERKKQLVQKLLQSGAHNQSGLQGLRSLPIFGGRGRGTSDAPSAALPALTFNPFLAMAAGRPQEAFQAPDGITSAALAQAQAGMRGQIGGPSPQETMGDPGQSAAAAFLGQGATTPGLDGPAAGSDPTQTNPAAGNPFDPSGQFLTSSGVRHLTGGGNSLTQVPRGFIPRLGSLIAS